MRCRGIFELLKHTTRNSRGKRWERFSKTCTYFLFLVQQASLKGRSFCKVVKASSSKQNYVIYAAEGFLICASQKCHVNIDLKKRTVDNFEP